MADSGDDSSSSDEVLTWQQRKGLKQSGAPFILEEAEVGEITDDDDQEEELDSKVDEDFIDDDDLIDNGNHEMYMKQPQAARVVNERPTPLQKLLETIGNCNEDEIEERFHNGSNEDETDEADPLDEGESRLNETAEEKPEPTPKDPKLWVVKCKIGQEKETVRQLMLKFRDSKHGKEPLNITSVVSHENSRGYIYVEAFKETDVKKAIDGIASLRPAFYKQLETVSVKKMSQVLRVTKKADNLTNAKPFSWVRLNKKPANFQGDICQVVYNAVKEQKFLLKLIPRVNFTTPRGTQKSPVPSNATTSTRRPLQQERKKINVDYIRAVGGTVNFGEKKFVQFERKWYSRSGFLYQTFPYSHVQGVVTPSLAEEAEFEDSDDEDLQLAFEVTSDLPGKFILDVVDVGIKTTAVMPEQEKPTAPMASVRKASGNKPSTSTPFTSRHTEKSTTAPFDRKAPSTSHQSRGGGRGDRRGGGSTNRESLIGKPVSVTSGFHKSKVGTVARVEGSTVHVDFPSTFQLFSFERCDVRVLEPAGNPANSHTDVHGASAQSGGTSHPIVSTPSPGRPFGNLDRNPQSHSSLIPGVSSPFRSPTPIAPQTAARQHEGSGSSYVEGVGSRTAPMLGSPTHNGYGSRSLAQPGRAWYHTSTNTSSRTLSTNEDSVSWSDNLFGGEMDGLSSRDWYTTEIEVRFRHTSQNMISGLINQIGIIRKMSGESASVFLRSDGRVVIVAGDLLEPVVPVRFDRVKIIHGDVRRGETGHLLEVDQQGGRVRLDLSGEEEVFQLRDLCKMPKL